MDVKAFRKQILTYYKKAGRHSLPWRHTRDPYEILVSEVMLQQTQVSRVLSKYPQFLSLFPTAEALAKAPVAEVLKAWQGLGYNRRALNLKKAAEVVVKDFAGTFPKTIAELESLPGIGQSTRGAIMAFAFGIPTVFIETNIRSIYLHHFFKGKTKIHDKKLLPLIEKTLDTKNPRDWYYALMDYGVHLKQTLPNPSRHSKHHSKQTAFKGSNREVRSLILSSVLKGTSSRKEIIKRIGKTTHDVEKNIKALISEGFIEEDSGLLRPKS
jgi:A/G-specific adenine glycosylase